MSGPVVPSLTDKRRELASSVIPGDEVGRVYSAYKSCLSALIKAYTSPPDVADIKDPPRELGVDVLIRTELVGLASGGIRNGLSKLAWMSFAVFDPDYTLDWEDDRYIPAAVLHRRLYQSDFYLSEFRLLKQNRGNDAWYVQMRSPDGGGVVQKRRVFPMWGIEVRHGLDNHEKALAWYRSRLRERGIVR